MMMNMDIVTMTHPDRVWCCKLNNEIDTYKTEIKAALKDRTKPGLKTERDRKHTLLEFVRDKTNKRLRTPYEYNLTDPDEWKFNEHMKI
eukprot:scaffold20702_cov56-Attheya_sp.AAC.2